MPDLHITKKTVEAVRHPKKGQVLYRDTALRGFGLRVGAKSKVYFAEGQVNHRTRRVTIGRADVVSPERARKKALNLLSDMALGNDPNAEKRKKAQEALSLAQAFAAFFEGRTKLAPSSRDSYQRTIKLYLKAWRQRPIAEISRQMVLHRHRQIAKDHGEVTANNVMRHLRSVYNFTAASHEEFPPNPVSILTQARAWYPEHRRRGVVTAADLPAWWEAVEAEPGYSRDFLLLALFTGMRRAEIAGLKWDHVDLKNRAIHIPKTKNGEPLDMPISKIVSDLLTARRGLNKGGPWVFPSSGKTGHLVETKTFTARVSERSGVKFSLHDLRRTFVTVAESLDVPHYALKRLLNHKTDSDVTGGYIVINTERLRDPVENVAKRILRLAHVQTTRTAFQ